jgi:branched-chain amino acid transport system substrate-binding protein
LVSTERAGREATSDLHQVAEAVSCLLDRPVEVSPKLKDFSEIGKQVMATQPDGILLWLDPTLAGTLTKSLRASGFTGQLAGPSRLQSTGFITNAGSATEGFLLPSPILDPASQSVAARFAVVYHHRFGDEPDATSRAAYDAVVLLADLLRKSGNNPPHLAFPITSEQLGASGRLKFDRNGNRIVPLELLKFREGCFTPFRGYNSHL